MTDSIEKLEHIESSAEPGTETLPVKTLAQKILEIQNAVGVVNKRGKFGSEMGGGNYLRIEDAVVAVQVLHLRVDAGLGLGDGGDAVELGLGLPVLGGVTYVSLFKSKSQGMMETAGFGASAVALMMIYGVLIVLSINLHSVMSGSLG